MNNLPVYFWPSIAILALLIAGYFFSKKKPIIPKLSFFNNKNKNQMTLISSLTLTSLLPLLVPFAVVDENNNNLPIPGTYTGAVVSVSDSTQDTASIPDPALQNVSVDAVTQQGNSVVTLNLNFSSTKLLPDGVTPAVTGAFTATLNLVNNVVVKAVLSFLGN